MGRDAGPVSLDHPPIPGGGWPKESSSWTDCSECTINYAASATGAHLIHAPYHTGVCSIDLIKKYISRD